MEKERQLAQKKIQMVRRRDSKWPGTIIHDNQSRFMALIICPGFKCAVTVPGDNRLIYSQDLSLVVITNDQKELKEFNVFAGGVGADTTKKRRSHGWLTDLLCGLG